MKRDGKYKSPSKSKRDHKRLLEHLFKTIYKIKGLLPRKPKLSISNPAITNYPEACLVCHQHQCEYDQRHANFFTLKLALDEQLETIWSRKPLDDVSGLLVATLKESKEASSFSS